MHPVPPREPFPPANRRRDTPWISLALALFVAVIATVAACGSSSSEGLAAGAPVTTGPGSQTAPPSAYASTRPAATAGIPLPEGTTRPAATTTAVQSSQPRTEGAPPPPPGTRPPTNSPGNPLSDEDLQKYVAQCRDRMDAARYSHVAWPDDFSLRLNEARTYRIVVDERTVPVDPTSLVGAPARSSGIVIQCQLSARLHAVDDGIEVEKVAEDEGGWRSQYVTPAGQLEWTWAVTGRKLGKHQVAVELKPAVAVSVGGEDPKTIDPGARVTKVTVISVEGTTLQKAADWLTTQGGYLKIIGSALLAGALWVVATYTQLGVAVKTAAKKLRPRRKAASRPTGARRQAKTAPPPQASDGTGSPPSADP